MRINLRGDAAYLLPRWRYISDKEKSGLYERAQDALHLHYGELRIGDFFDCIRCDFSVIGVCSTWNNATQAQYIWAMGFADYMENFSKMLERMTLRGTAEQQQAQMVCLRVGFEESVLVFLQDFFGLHSFKEAEDITRRPLNANLTIYINLNKKRKNEHFATYQRERRGGRVCILVQRRGRDE